MCNIVKTGGIMRRDQNIINIEKPISSVTEYIKTIDMLLTKKAAKERIFVFRGEPQKHITFCQPNIFRKNVLSTNKFYEKSLFNTMRQNRLSNSNSYLENAIAGEGDVDYERVKNALKSVNYKGVYSMEYSFENTEEMNRTFEYLASIFGNM